MWQIMVYIVFNKGYSRNRERLRYWLGSLGHWYNGWSSWYNSGCTSRTGGQRSGLTAGDCSGRRCGQWCGDSTAVSNGRPYICTGSLVIWVFGFIIYWILSLYCKCNYVNTYYIKSGISLCYIRFLIFLCNNM